MRPGRTCLAFLPAVAVALLSGCGNSTKPGCDLSISPDQLTLGPGGTVQFSFAFKGAGAPVSWTASDGAVTAQGAYTAPAAPGDYTVAVQSTTDLSCIAIALVHVVVPDSGTPDSGSPDSGSPDSGSPDSGSPDSGSPDSGSPDSGSPDSGSPDGGQLTATCAPIFAPSELTPTSLRVYFQTDWATRSPACTVPATFRVIVETPTAAIFDQETTLTQFDITGLQSNVAYGLRVDATSAAGVHSGFYPANGDAHITLVSLPPPPTNLSTSLIPGVATQAKLAFTAPPGADGGAVIARIYSAPAILDGGPGVYLPIPGYYSMTSPITLAGLTEGSFQFLAMASVLGSNIDQESALSDPTTLQLPSLPGAPQFVTVDGGNRSALIGWTPPADGGTGGVLFYNLRVTGGYTQFKSVSAPATSYLAKSFNSPDAGPSFVQVAAQGPWGSGPSSAPVQLFILYPPGAVPGFDPATGLSSPYARPGTNSAELSWLVPTDPGVSPIDGYTVYVADAGGDLNAAYTITVPSDVQRTKVSSLTNGKTYWLNVTAHNSDGDGPPGNWQYVSPQPVNSMGVFPATPQFSAGSTAQAVSAGGGVHLVGGASAQGQALSTTSFAPADFDGWMNPGPAAHLEVDPEGDLALPRTGHVAVGSPPGSADAIFAVGGKTASGQIAGDAEAASLDGGASLGPWKGTGSALAVPRYDHAGAASGHYVFVAGGLTQNSDGGNVEFVTDDVSVAARGSGATLLPWSATTRLPTPRFGAAAVAVDSTLYVLGGQLSTSQNTPTADVLSAAIDSQSGALGSWTGAGLDGGGNAPLPSARWHSAAAGLSNGNGSWVYLAGGTPDSIDGRFPSSELLIGKIDPSTHFITSWTTVDLSNVGTASHPTAAISGTSLYILQGDQAWFGIIDPLTGAIGH